MNFASETCTGQSVTGYPVRNLQGRSPIRCVRSRLPAIDQESLGKLGPAGSSTNCTMAIDGTGAR